MGTTVIVVTSDDRRWEVVRDWFETVEQVCSRFRSDSELMWLNNSPEPRVRVSPMLASLLRCAARSRDRTSGLVDSGVGSAVIDWGYDRTFSAIRDLATAPQQVPTSGWSIDGDVVTRTQGTRIDLGGIAKGWTCDIAVEQGMALLVSAGGDLRSVDKDTAAIIADSDGTAVATVAVGNGALATSSTGKRRWLVGGKEAHHLIDPRTGSPANSPIVSATVTAATAAEAEAGAKAVLLRGADGLAWADRCPWIKGALVIWNDGSVYATSGIEVAA